MSERRRRSTWAWLLAAPFLLAFKPAGDEEIVNSFDLIVFNAEHREMTLKVVRKWVMPIRIYLDIRVPEPNHYVGLTQDTVDRLATASGHDIRIVSGKAGANVISTFDRMDGLMAAVEARYPGDAWIKEIVNNNLCTGRFFSNDRGEIYRADIFIPTDRASSAGKLPACVIEETAQILGLPNDSDQVAFSIFNDYSNFMDLTAQDLMLIRLLYDARLVPGMGRAEALATVRRILRELRR